MTTENRLSKSSRKEKSPTDPKECVEWANARLIEAGDFSRQWVVTGSKERPIALVRNA